jgi:hypothetical protein
MGDAAESARAYANEVSKAMGIDVAEWMQNQGVFKNLVSGFGVAEKSANTMSQNLTQLSYDMASFFNTDVETAFDKLSSAMSGQVKGLREFGIDTTVASLQEYALARGIDKSVRSMTQAEKSMLRYNYIMEKSTIMQGDMARTLVTPANALRILSAQLTQAKRALGNIVSVIVARFIPYVQAMVEIVTDAANALANLLGFELPTIDYSGLDKGGFFKEDEENFEGMQGTIKKIKKQLMGFDELNILSSPDSSGGSDDDGGNSLNMKPIEYNFLEGLDTSKIEDIKEKIYDIFEVAEWIGITIAGWKLGSFISSLITANIKATTLKESLALIGKKAAITVGITLAIVGLALEIDGIKGAIEDGLDGVDFGKMFGGGVSLTGGVALAAKAFGASAGTIFLSSGVAAIIAGIPMALVGIYDAIKNGLTWLSGMLIPIGTSLAGAGTGAVVAAIGAKFGATVGTAISPGLGTLIGLAIGAITGLLIDLGILVYQKWDEICEFFRPAWEWVRDNVFQPIMDFLSPVAEWFDQNVIQPIVDTFADIKNAFLEIYNYAKEKYLEIKNGVIEATTAIWSKIEEIGAKIKEIFSALWWAFKEYFWNPMVDKVSKFYNDKIKPVVDKVKNAFREVWLGFKEKIVDPIADKIQDFKEKLKKLKDDTIELFKKIGITVVDFISNSFKSVINGILSKTESAINKFIRLLNKAIGIINDIPGVEITKLTELTIPRLADGGFVSEGQMFIAREAGPELVGSIGRKTAVANNDQIISGIESGVYRAMMAANSTNGGGTQTIRIINEIDGDVVGEKVIRYHNGKVMQTGVSPLLV